jgi:hypothetical protein
MGSGSVAAAAMSVTISSDLDDDLGALREPEIAAALSVLADRRPAVLLVCGAAGAGKSVLMRVVAERAAAQGWNVASELHGDVPPLHPDITERRYRDEVLSAVLRGARDDPHSRSRREAAVEGTVVPRRGLDPFIDELGRHAPVLLAIDDYRPSRLFAEWFEGAFLPQLGRCGAPVVVAIAHRPGGGRLATRATDTIDLDDLDAGRVRELLERLRDRVSPPLEDDEIERYAHEARNPLVLSSLVRVLTFTAPPTTAELP